MSSDKLSQEFQNLINKGPSSEGSKGWAFIKAPQTHDERGKLTVSAVNLIIEQAVKQNASDIHIEPYQQTIRIRYRIDGQLNEALIIENIENFNIIQCVKVMCNLETDSMSRRKSQDGRFASKFGASSYDFRVSTFPTVEGEKMVIRILQQDAVLHSLEAIGLNQEDQNHITKLLALKSGLLLICGPTGSGKTTSLYAMLSKLNSKSHNIVTLENPVEYHIPGMNQCDIKENSQFTFADGLRAVLRQDPDVILVGEIRDQETAEIATRAAITGHLVFSSIHANSAIGTIVRLINMGLDPVLVSFAMVGAIAQRLVRRICDECKTSYNVNYDQLRKLKEIYGIDLKELLMPSPTGASSEGIQYINTPDPYNTTNEFVLYEGKGCGYCNGQGFKGRVGIFEIVYFNQDIRDGIVRKAGAKELQDIATKSGTRLLAWDALNKVKLGLTTIDEIYPLLIET